MKSKILLSVFAMALFFIACSEGDGCKDLSWESDGYTASSQVSFKASAGEKCENYNDYYEGDLNQIITKIKKMKFVLNRKCYEMTSIDSDPEEVEVECPEFVPETIEFSEMVKCEFGTPPNENTSCAPYGPVLYFKSGNNIVRWGLIKMDNPRIIIDESDYAFEYEINGVKVGGSFEDASMEEAMIKFTWTEDEVEKTLEFTATVETKE